MLYKEAVFKMNQKKLSSFEFFNSEHFQTKNIQIYCNLVTNTLHLKLLFIKKGDMKLYFYEKWKCVIVCKVHLNNLANQIRKPRIIISKCQLSSEINVYNLIRTEMK